MDGGPEALDEAERRAVDRQARRVRRKATLLTLLLTAISLAVPPWGPS